MRLKLLERQGPPLGLTTRRYCSATIQRWLLPSGITPGNSHRIHRRGARGATPERCGLDKGEGQRGITKLSNFTLTPLPPGRRAAAGLSDMDQRGPKHAQIPSTDTYEVSFG